MTTPAASSSASGRRTAQPRTVSSGAAYNDNQWHMVTATMGPQGMALYVDGVRVGRRTRHDRGRGLPRLLAGRRRQPRRLAEPPEHRQLHRLRRRGRGLPDRALTRPRSSPSTRPAGAPRRSRRLRPTAMAPPSTPTSPTCTGASARPAAPRPPTPASRSTTARTATGVTLGSAGHRRRQHGCDVRRQQRVRRPTTRSSRTRRSSPRRRGSRPPPHRGGKIIGFGNNQTGSSGSYDRHVYMQDDGRLVFGVWTGQTNTITTHGPYNDGDWHHVVATQWSERHEAVRRRRADRAPTRRPQAQAYDGYWKVGGDNTWGSSQQLLRRHHRRGGRLLLRAEPARVTRVTSSPAAACSTRHPTAAFTSQRRAAPGHLRRQRLRPTPTARSPATPGTSVTSTTGSGANAGARLRRRPAPTR